MYNVSSKFDQTLREILDLLALEGFTRDQVAERSRMLDEKGAFTHGMVKKWQQCNIPSPDDFRLLVRVLESLKDDSRFPTLANDTVKLISAYTNGGTRQELFRTAGEYIDAANGDMPMPALWIAIMQAPDVRLSVKTLRTELEKNGSSLPKTGSLLVLQGKRLPTGAETKDFLKVCNDAIAASGGTPLSEERIAKMAGFADQSLDAFNREDMSIALKKQALQRKMDSWLAKNHIIQNSHECRGTNR